MSNFYQKRATLEEYDDQDLFSINPSQIIRKNSNNVNQIEDDEYFGNKDISQNDEMNDIHECGDPNCSSHGDQNRNHQKDNHEHKEKNFENMDMSYNKIFISNLKERNTAPPKIPQFPTQPFSVGNDPFHLRKKVGFPSLKNDINLGRDKSYSEHLKNVNELNSQSLQDNKERDKMVEENLKLQRKIEESRKIRSGEGPSMLGDLIDGTHNEQSFEDMKQSVHKENENLLKNMTPQEIQELREQIFSKLDPELVKKLEKRSFIKKSMNMDSNLFKKNELSEEEKLEWTKDVDPNQKDLSNEPRFDFNGNIIEKEPEIYNPSLYHHGVDQHKAGYTLSEIIYLCRSSFPGQKILNLEILSKIILNQKTKNSDEYYKGMFLTLIDEYQLPILLNITLKEKNVNIIRASLETLISFIQFPETESWLLHIEKFSILGILLAPFMKPSKISDPDIIIEPSQNLKNVTGTAKNDLLKAFVEMDIFDSIYKICQSLDDYEGTNISLLVLEVLKVFTLHSHDLAFQILENILFKSYNSSKSILSKLYDSNPIETLKLLRFILRYSKEDCKSLLKTHTSLLLDCQVSIAAFSSGDVKKFALMKEQILLLKIILGHGELIQFISDTFNSILIIFRSIFNLNTSNIQLEASYLLFDLIESYSRGNPTDQICHLRIFVESDLLLIIRKLHEIILTFSEATNSERYLLYLKVYASCLQFCSSFYSSIVHCSAHKLHTIDSTNRVEKSFFQSENPIIDLLKEMYSFILFSINSTNNFEFNTINYPENLISFPINVYPNEQRDSRLQILTAILRLLFYLSQGFPTTKKSIIHDWLINDIYYGKDLYIQLVLQQSKLYQGNIYIMKFTNQILSELGSLILDIHFLIHGYSDDSCIREPSKELTFFLFLSYTTTSLNVFQECVKRICWNHYQYIEKESIELQDNPSDWIFSALEKEYRNHEYENPNSIAMTQTILLLNTIYENAPLYLDTFISPFIQLVNVLKVILSIGNDDPLYNQQPLVDQLNIYLKRYYSSFFENNNNILINSISSENMEHLNKIIKDLIDAFRSNSFNHPTFFAFLCIFLDSMWPLSIQIQILKQIDIFKLKLTQEIGNYFKNCNDFAMNNCDSQFVDYLLFENTGLIGSNRNTPLYQYFTKRIIKFINKSEFYQNQYAEELRDYPELLEDLNLSQIML